jgi:hypothetical protein
MVKIRNLGKSFNGPNETSIANWAGISATETLRFATEVLLKEDEVTGNWPGAYS